MHTAYSSTSFRCHQLAARGGQGHARVNVKQVQNVVAARMELERGRSRELGETNASIMQPAPGSRILFYESLHDTRPRSLHDR